MSLPKLITVLTLFLAFAGNSQQLVDNIKKKFYGIYEGNIPSFEYNTGQDLIRVDATNIRIQLSEDAIIIELGNIKKSGIYTVLFRGDGYYVLDATFEGQLQHERIVVHERKKTLTREGSFPQPNASLDKLSRREEKALMKTN